MIKTVTIILAIVSLAAPAAGAPGAARHEVAARFGLVPRDTLPAAPTLADYLGYALARSEDLGAAEARRAAAEGRRDASGTLPDPRVTWSEALAPVETRLGPQERILALTQQVPWFGTLGLQRDVAGARAEAAAARARAVALDVLHEARVAYHELDYAARARDITAGHLDLMEQLEAVARARYETGEGGYADLVKAQVELARLEDRLQELQDLDAPLAARFNAALGRDATAPVRAASLADTAAVAGIDTLRARMLAANPALTALAREADGALRSRDLAGKRGYPDLSLGVNWVQVGDAADPDLPDGGKDAAFATLGVSLPLWRGRYAADERAAAGAYRAAEHGRADLALRLAARLERAHYDLRDARRRQALYRDALLPKARQALAAARAAYETGTAGFLDLVDAERALLAFELAAARARVDGLIGRADIERIIAGPAGPGGG